MRKRDTNLAILAAVGVGGYLLWKKYKKVPTLGPIVVPTGPVLPPRPPSSGEEIPEIAFQGGGESSVTLPQGAQFVVAWPEDAPWQYVAQDTETNAVVDEGPNFFVFEAVSQMPTGGVDTVFVQALDQGELVAEHKVTVHGP